MNMAHLHQLLSPIKQKGPKIKRNGKVSGNVSPHNDMFIMNKKYNEREKHQIWVKKSYIKMC